MQIQQRFIWLSGLSGLALVIVGVALYRHQKQLAGSSLGKLSTKRMNEAPVINSYNDGNMKTQLRASRDMPIEQRLATIQRLVRESVQDGQMRKYALEATKDCPERDGLCEAQAIYRYVKQRVRYTGDVAPIQQEDGSYEGIDLYQSARRTLEFGGGDCLPLSTLVLRDDFQLVPLVELDAGNRIMANGHWTTVQERWLTGEKPVLAFELSNGCVLRCTAEHRIFRNVDGRVEEIRASEARIGDDLVTPETLPVAGVRGDGWPAITASLSDEELSWLLGIFVADGWADGKHTKEGWHPYRVGISGADGKPKEEQKRRVQALMEKIGVATRWHHKYIAINDSSLARFFAQFGHTAPNKHVSLQHVAQNDVRALIEGLSADADRRDNVHSTTSPKMALQLRVLYRMLGQSTHIRRVDDHGGLGEHPIYRVTPRTVERSEARRDLKFARIRSIRDGGVDMCMDLTTEHGQFWLPESDTMVHNCDDQSILIATLLALNGITPRLRVMKEKRGDDWSHIYPGALLPKFGGERFVAIDTTLPGDRHFGVEVPAAETLDFVA